MARWPPRTETRPTTRKRDSRLLDELPKDAEQQALEAVRQDARRQAPAEEAEDAVLGDDRLGRGPVADVALVRLAVRLEDAERVGARIRDDGGGEADDGLALEMGGGRKGRGDEGEQESVRRGGGGRGQAAAGGKGDERGASGGRCARAGGAPRGSYTLRTRGSGRRTWRRLG